MRSASCVLTPTDFYYAPGNCDKNVNLLAFVHDAIRKYSLFTLCHIINSYNLLLILLCFLFSMALKKQRKKEQKEQFRHCFILVI